MQIHRIQKFAIEVNASSQQAAPFYQSEARRAHEAVFEPILEDTLNELVDGETYLSIDRLEVDLRLKEGQPWESLRDVFREKLVKALQEKGVFPGKASFQEWETPESLRAEKWLIHFLRTGRLPWWKEPPPSGEMDKAFEKWISSDSEAMEWIKAELPSHPELIARIALQFSSRIFIAFLEKLILSAASRRLIFSMLTIIGRDAKAITSVFASRSPERSSWYRLARHWPKSEEEKDALESFVMEQLSFASSPLLRTSLKEEAEAWETVLESLSERRKTELAFRILYSITQRRESHSPVSLGASRLIDSLKKDPSPEAIGWRAHPTVKKALSILQATARSADEPAASEEALLDSPSARISESVSSLKSPARESALSEDRSRVPSETFDEPQAPWTDVWPDDQDEPIYISNAGLVLFAPYLQSLFAKCGIHLSLTESERRNAERAPLLLQYLTDFSEESPEFNLPMNKLLCGLPLDSPLPRNLELSFEKRSKPGSCWKRSSPTGKRSAIPP